MRFAALFCLVLSGCYHVQITAEPVSASVGILDRPPIVDRRVRLTPLSRREVEVAASGYRPQVFKVRWRLLGWLRRSHEIEVRLVEEHGGAGSAR